MKATRQPKYNVEVMVRDRAYHGTYTVSDVKLELSSAYGSITKPVGSSKPEKLAKAMLTEIVERSRKKRPRR